MMVEAVGDRAAVARDETSSTTNQPVSRSEDLDRAAQEAGRSTNTSPYALVKLSKEARAALRRPAHDAEELAQQAGANEKPRPPPAPQKRRVQMRPSEALARYRQVAEDPASIFFAENSPFRSRAAAGAPVEATAPRLEPPPEPDTVAPE